jgi:FMN phosphatase YigB (HAD superfamily)
LFDVGGIFFLPERARVVAAFARGGFDVDPDRIDDAHYQAAAHFTTELDVEAEWAGSWLRYLDAYIDACGVPEELREDAHEHVDSEFADAALWVQPIHGAKEGLVALAETGVRLGIVSNADGLMAQRLREQEILQVGPGVGVEVACVIDSGNVGVMKPDPRIFELALDAMDVDAREAWYVGDMPAFDVVGARRAGLRPFVLSRCPDLHPRDYEVVASLADIADLAARHRFTLEAAFDAAERDEVARWVGDFLASRGSDNEMLAAALAQRPHWWLGPILLPVEDLVRLAGPEDDALCPIEPADWEHDVERMEQSVERGWKPPPLLVEHRDGRLLLQDGNHRYEALVREGETDAWALVWFDDPAERDRFRARSTSVGPSPPAR